jgi:hypothetical protein
MAAKRLREGGASAANDLGFRGRAARRRRSSWHRRRRRQRSASERRHAVPGGGRGRSNGRRGEWSSERSLDESSYCAAQYDSLGDPSSRYFVSGIPDTPFHYAWVPAELASDSGIEPGTAAGGEPYRISVIGTDAYGRHSERSEAIHPVLDSCGLLRRSASRSDSLTTGRASGTRLKTPYTPSPWRRPPPGRNC